MKNYFHRYAFTLLLSSIISVAASQQSNNIVTIQVYFDSPPTNVEVSKAILKFNKDFAYSLTLDDGKAQSYSVVYPFFKGGTITENGNNYSGLFYSDGCGNRIPFTGGIAITSVNFNGEDSHINNPANISWDQLTEMYNNGWYVYNHSYSHSTGAGTEYNFEIVENVEYVKTQTGIDLTHFVVPSGDVNYITPAFNAGMKAVYNQNSFPGSNGFQVDGSIDFNNFGLIRRFIDDANYNSSNISAKIDEISGKSINGNHYWFNDFTHIVSTSPVQGGLAFSTFESYMNHIQDVYGIAGSDRVWMAPLQEVYEYLVMRERVNITTNLSGNTLEINLDFSNVPTDLRKYALSLLIKSDQSFSYVVAPSDSKNTFNGTSQTKLINLEWNKYPVEIINTLKDFTKENNCINQSPAIFPNPFTHGIVQLNLHDVKSEVLLNLYDLTGKVYSLGTYNSASGVIELNTEKLPQCPGRYLLQIISQKENCSYFKEIVKY